MNKTEVMMLKDDIELIERSIIAKVQKRKEKLFRVNN